MDGEVGETHQAGACPGGELGSLAVCGVWKQNRRDLWVVASGATWWKSND